MDFGGESHYRENFLDPFISTVALAPVTTRIITISTVHVLYGNWHPLHLARFAATADHISGGRFGLNIVTGYDATEPLMFGMDRIEHDARYDRAGEFSSIMEQLWAGEDNVTFDGRFYKLEGAYVSPRPTL
ncbi:MAG: LLM class flavin-dependent oxidoreductase [Bradyrhizobium sp.]